MARHLSNVYLLWKKSGWVALLIEGAEDRFSKLLDECRNFPNVFPVKALIDK